MIGAKGVENITKFVLNLNEENVDYYEALAAKEYFSLYHKGLNRRVEDPINSRLNYGYAVVRSAIARKLVSTGFHPTFGIHHDSQLNAFNLADDLIEPYRAMVDLVVHQNIGSNLKLTKTEYTNLRKFLIKDGYLRIAPEVYMRIVQNRKASEKHYRRIQEFAPKTGTVKLLPLTEKQYQSIYMVAGEPDYQEQTVGANCHIII